MVFFLKYNCMNFSFTCILHVPGLNGFLDCYCHLFFKQNMTFRREADFISSQGKKQGCSTSTNSVVSDNEA